MSPTPGYLGPSPPPFGNPGNRQYARTLRTTIYHHEREKKNLLEVPPRRWQCGKRQQTPTACSPGRHRGLSQFGFGGLERGEKQLLHVHCRFVEVEAHLVAAKTLGDNVEVDAINRNQLLVRMARELWCSPILIDHVCNAKSAVNDLAPAIPIEELAA